MEFSKLIFKRNLLNSLLFSGILILNTFNAQESTAKNKENISKNDLILDIGPQTRMLFYNEILKTKTILWNGPLGYVEKKPYDEGTIFVLQAIRANKIKNFFLLPERCLQRDLYYCLVQSY